MHPRTRNRLLRTIAAETSETSGTSWPVLVRLEVWRKGWRITKYSNRLCQGDLFKKKRRLP